MSRRFLSVVTFILALVLVLQAFSGCVEFPGGNDPGTATRDPESLSSPMMILDNDGNTVTSIPADASCTLFDEGIFYRLWYEDGDGSGTGTAEYRLVKNDGKDVLLGKRTGEGYEASYARLSSSGIIYTTAVDGDPYDFAPDRLVLLAFDASKGSMNSYTVTENGYPYTALAAAGGKVLIMNHEMGDIGEDTIYEFDPGTKAVKKILSFDTSEESLRSLCTTDDGFALLRLKIGGKNELFVDFYANDYTKKSEKSLSGLIASAASEILTPEDAANEASLLVFGFKILDGRYMFYENAGIIRLILDLETDTVLKAMNDLYCLSGGDGKPLFYKLEFDLSETQAGLFDVVTVSDGKPGSGFIGFSVSGRMLRHISVSRNGSRLIRVIDVSGTQSLKIIDGEG